MRNLLSYLKYLLVFSVSIFCLASCATPQDARQKGAVAIFVSNKPVKEIVDCVASAWENNYGMTIPVSVRPTKKGYTLQISSSGNTQVVLDVNETSNGSESHYFKGYVFFEDKWDKDVRSCQ